MSDQPVPGDTGPPAATNGAPVASEATGTAAADATVARGATPADAWATSDREPLRLGGMALRNGLLIHGPTQWAAAVRDRHGTIQASSGPKPTFSPGLAGKVPFLRGPLKLAEAFAVIPVVRMRLPAARLPFEDPAVATAMVTSVAANAFLRRYPGGLARELTASALGLAPALISLRGAELASYHGVEHKAIGAYEAGHDDPTRQPKEHERCGSNLIAPLMAFSVGGQLLVEALVEEPGQFSRAAVAVGGISAAVEMFAWSERHADSSLARAFHRPGTEIQRLIATREPSHEQLEVGRAAMREILRVEGGEGYGQAP